MEATRHLRIEGKTRMEVSLRNSLVVKAMTRSIPKTSMILKAKWGKLVPRLSRRRDLDIDASG